MITFLKKPVVIIAAIVVVVAAVFVVLFLQRNPVPSPVVEQVQTGEPIRRVIGASVEGRQIESFTYNTAAPGGADMGTASSPQPKHILFVGGIHGGYEWNSVLLAYQMMDYLREHGAEIPAGLSVTIIPSLNPDAVYKVTGKEGRFASADVSDDTELLASARFNAHGVDLNRNFDCNWQPKSTWRQKTVSGGTAAFSEPEAKALQHFVLEYAPTAVIFWHSQANTVYASRCNRPAPIPMTLDIMNAYAQAADYNTSSTFTSYVVTGDSEGWLASIGIPAITVELETHESVEWDRNLAGVRALLDYFK